MRRPRLLLFSRIDAKKNRRSIDWVSYKGNLENGLIWQIPRGSAFALAAAFLISCSETCRSLSLKSRADDPSGREVDEFANYNSILSVNKRIGFTK